MNYKGRFNFVKHSRLYFTSSIIATLLGVLVLAIFGLNYGIDFSSGTTLDIQTNTAMVREEIKPIFDEINPDNVITMAGENSDRVSVRFKSILTEDERRSIMSAFEEKYGKDQLSVEENTVDADMAREFALRALGVLGLASLGIVIYVSIRFEWRFAVSAVIALLHNAFFVVTVFSIFRLEISLTFIAAILTIIGYSINDTIVIFDRIRENMKTAKLKNRSDVEELVNRSIWQSLTRSINTVLTVLVVVLGLYIFGSEAIRLFSLALFIGLTVGAYSSIFIASQLWVVFKNKTLNPARKTAAS